MKANELTIGQKYIWRRNSSVSHEVTYLGCDDSGKFPMYEFEYFKEGWKVQTLLSVHHVDSDVMPKYTQTRALTIEDLKPGFTIRANWNGATHEIIRIENNIVVYDWKADPNKNYADGYYRDPIDVVLREFKKVV